MTTEVIRLKQASSRTLTPLLKPLINKQGHIASYDATNTLIIADYVGNLIRIKNLLIELDKNPADSFELISLKNTSANEVSRILNLINQGTETAALNTYSIVAVDGSNSILLRGQRSLIDQFKLVIRDLDNSNFESSNIKVVYLKYAQAEEVVSILENVSKLLKEKRYLQVKLMFFQLALIFIKIQTH